MDRHLPQIDVRDQARLPPGRVLELCIKGIKHRFFRTILTFSVVVMAVTFFMSLLTGAIAARGADNQVRAHRGDLALGATALAWWFAQPTPASVLARLDLLDAGDRALVAAIGSIDATALGALAEQAGDERRLRTWLSGLDAGTRSRLLSGQRAADPIQPLNDPARLATFRGILAADRSLRCPLTSDRLERTALGREALRSRIQTIAGAWSQTVARNRTAMQELAGDEAGWTRWIAQADPARLQSLAALLAANGLAGHSSVTGIAAVQQDLATVDLRSRIATALNSEAGRITWKQTFLANPPLDEKMLQLDDERAHRALGGAFSREELARVQRRVEDEIATAQVEDRLRGRLAEDGSVIGGRMAFLVLISFVVCMVGIANAMLMAITERFREIATMKCLGATDGFILSQFLMEAGILGLVGGVAGAIIGLLIAVVQGWILFGGYFWSGLPLGQVALCAAASLVAGVLLATLASVYPSWKASHMAPMDAMRVE